MLWPGLGCHPLPAQMSKSLLYVPLRACYLYLGDILLIHTFNQKVYACTVDT